MAPDRVEASPSALDNSQRLTTIGVSLDDPDSGQSAAESRPLRYRRSLQISPARQPREQGRLLASRMRRGPSRSSSGCKWDGFLWMRKRGRKWCLVGNGGRDTLAVGTFGGRFVALGWRSRMHSKKVLKIYHQLQPYS
nr:uncharacterized protein LOC110128841 [Odocoileus virginianus texanus]